MLKVYRFNRYAKYTIGIIAAQHGNEKSPSICIQKLLYQNYFKKKAIQNNICIIVIPIVNEWGYYWNTRTRYGIDINRSYNGKNSLNNNIMDIVKLCDLVLDFHEGWGYYNDQKGSIGSTITCNSYKLYPKTFSIIHEMNKHIVLKNQKFAINVFNPMEYKDSLIYYCTSNNIKCAVIEITGQNNISPLKKRLSETFFIINSYISLKK